MRGATRQILLIIFAFSLCKIINSKIIQQSSVKPKQFVKGLNCHRILETQSLQSKIIKSQCRPSDSALSWTALSST